MHDKTKMVCTVNLWDCILFKWNIFLVASELTILAISNFYLFVFGHHWQSNSVVCFRFMHSVHEVALTQPETKVQYNENNYVTVYPHSMEPKVKLQVTHTVWKPNFLSKLKLTRLGCKESFRCNQYVGKEMAYKLYFTSCIKELGLHCITYYYIGYVSKGLEPNKLKNLIS